MAIPLVVENVAYREVSAGFRSPLHANEAQQWFLCTHGTLIVEAAAERFELGPGESVLIPPGIQRADASGARPPGYVMALFSLAGFDPAPLHLRRAGLGGELLHEVRALVDELICRRGPTSDLLVEALLVRLLVGSMRSVSAVPAAPANAPADAEIVVAVEGYLREHLHRPIKRAEIARAVRLSPTHVARLFAAQAGCTLLERLTQLRIERAKEMLLASSMPVSDIAGKVGITSFSHFTRLFTRQAGMVPTDYRRRGGHWRSGSGRLGRLEAIPSWCQPGGGDGRIEQTGDRPRIEAGIPVDRLGGMPSTVHATPATPVPITVAVLGLGGMGSTHVRAAQESPVVSSVVGYEPDAERAAQRGRELGIAATADLDSILADPAVRLVCIAAPNAVHADLAIRAMEAGKAVLCEKPMGDTVAEARRILEAEARTGAFLQIGFELHYSRMYQQAKAWIDAGLIGEVLNVQCRYYASEFHGRGTWRSLSSATLVGEKMSHYLDLMRWWMGADPTEVHAASAPNAVDYFNHPDNHQAIIRFPGGRIGVMNFIMGLPATFHGDVLQDLLQQQMDDGHFLQYHICGSRGAIETDVFRRRVRRWRYEQAPEKMLSSIVETTSFGKDEDGEWFHNVHGQNLRVMELVAGGRPPESRAADAFSTMRLCFAVERSCRECRTVRLDEI